LLYGSPQLLQSLFFAENGLHGNKADKKRITEIKELRQQLPDAMFWEKFGQFPNIYRNLKPIIYNNIKISNNFVAISAIWIAAEL
jgi:hypothetical protein